MCARRAVLQELSRDRILEEARCLFASRGYEALTMRSIAQALGYSHGALYYHFRDKAELFYALVVEDFERLLYSQKRILHLVNPGATSYLKTLMMEFIHFGLDHPHQYEIMFMVRDPDLQRYAKAKQNECMELFTQVVAEIIGDGPGSLDKKACMPWTLFMSLHGFVSYCIQNNQSFDDVQKLAESHVDYLCQGLSSTPQSEA